MKRIVLILVIPFLLTLLHNNAVGQNDTLAHNIKPTNGSSSLSKQLVSNLYEGEKESNSTTAGKPTEISFTVANWALGVLAIILALLGVILSVLYLIDRKNQYSASKFKREIEDLRKSLKQKTEFNLKAAEVTFQSMEYLSYMFLSQNPEIDKDKQLLKMINENKNILYLFHEDRDEVIRVLKDLENHGTDISVEVLRKFRESTEDKKLKALADLTIDKINRREGAKEALEKKEQKRISDEKKTTPPEEDSAGSDLQPVP